MTFLYREWDTFCRALAERGIRSIPAREVAGKEGYLVLKHDVETDVARAHRMASIEAAHGHRGSYYVQAYLLANGKNVTLLSEMKAMGHEISYHYDVMDACRGDLSAAMAEFERNRALFEACGFRPETVCQHGNPIVERVGYTSNRDFFRSPLVRGRYPALSDIMVNFPEAKATEYAYFSDAGRRFKRIYDPLTNDVVDSSDKDIPYDTFADLLTALTAEPCAIVSTHPHRYSSSATVYRLKAAAFTVIRKTAKLLIKLPLMKKLMSRFYHLAKKI